MNAAQRFSIGACGGRKPFPDFSVTRGAWSAGLIFRQAIDMAGENNFPKSVTAWVSTVFAE